MKKYFTSHEYNEAIINLEIMAEDFYQKNPLYTTNSVHLDIGKWTIIIGYSKRTMFPEICVRTENIILTYSYVQAGLWKIVDYIIGDYVVD